MSSSLFQVRITDRNLTGFVTPSSQPRIAPMNCAAVSGQLLGLISPGTADEMTRLGQGRPVEEWADHASKVIGSPVTIHTQPATEFTRFFAFALFPGFATLMLSLPTQNSIGHYVVVGKRLDGNIVILDPQKRRGYVTVNEYFPRFSPPHTRFLVLFRDAPKTLQQHERDALSFSAPMMDQCKISSRTDAMDEDPPQSTDVEMKRGGRKRRKTRRRLLAKRTLRRVNRRRRIL